MSRDEHHQVPINAGAGNRADWREHGILVVAEPDPCFTWNGERWSGSSGAKLYCHRRVARDSEQEWTPMLVAGRLAEAADVLARLPDDRLRGLYNLWPRLVGELWQHARPAAGAPEAIDRMDEALGWLLWLEPEEPRLVWLRAAPAWLLKMIRRGSRTWARCRAGLGLSGKPASQN